MKLNVGENIRRLRRGADMTQEQLADKLGVAYQSVSRWENGTTYPDMEFLPVLAGIFGVTVDELIGCEESLKKERLDRMIGETLGRLFEQGTPKAEDYLSLLREVRHECMSTPALRDYGLMDMLMHIGCRWNDEYRECPELMKEIRMCFEEIMSSSHSREVKDEAVRYMAYMEDEDNIHDFLEKHATRFILRADNLLYERYRRQKCYDKEEELRKKLLFESLENGIFSSELFRIGEGVLSLQENLHLNTTRLTFLHNLCSMTPDPAHPITGDGSVDIFVPDRVDLGIRRACYLAATGDTEGAFVVLEDTVTLLETVMNMETGTELACSSRWLQDFRLKVEQNRYEAGKVLYLRLKTDPYHYCFGAICPTDGILPLTADHGWEWFDTIRDDPRFASYVDRVKAVFALDSTIE